MKVNSFNASPEERYKRINKLLKENFGVNLKSNPNPQQLLKMKKKLVEKNNTLRHEKQAHMKNKEFARNMLMLDAINNALLVARRQQAAKRALNEGTNVDKAEVVIAANSFLDDLQDSLEKVGRLQNETLGPIADRMRDYYGSDVANSFYEKVNEEFDTVMDALRDAKKSIGSAITSVSKGKTVEDDSDIDRFDDDMDERDMAGSDDEGGDEEADASDLDIDLSELEGDLEGAEEAGRERKVSENRRRKTRRKKRLMESDVANGVFVGSMEMDNLDDIMSLINSKFGDVSISKRNSNGVTLSIIPTGEPSEEAVRHALRDYDDIKVLTDESVTEAKQKTRRSRFRGDKVRKMSNTAISKKSKKKGSSK